MKGIFKKPESESGAAIIEFALGVPFLLIFAMAAMEFGQISAATTAVDNAAHAAARELAVNPNGDASSAKEAAVNAASSFFAENMKIETDGLGCREGKRTRTGFPIQTDRPIQTGSRMSPPGNAPRPYP